ncbi:MAG TPA: hypothetical protein VEQ59_18485 [Polyangiaceae bacterium]|nr:hypothetical protein [Polyangiaceae bacterium]
MDQSHGKVTQAHAARAHITAFALLLCACSANASDPGAPAEDVGGEGSAGAPSELAPDTSDLPYARSVESFTLGDGAGFNASKFPGVVLGPPQGFGTGKGSLDVLSLGAGGEIVLGFGELGIVDAPGPDLIVFENPFWPGGEASQVFAELGEVSLSEDGEDWRAFSCDTEGDGAGHFAGCAGVTPTLAYDATRVVPLDPALTGGDVFDLADVGLNRARFVKIRDLGTIEPAGGTGGFDLDAVGLIHFDGR